ncbi:ABC transporter ATP-binding protein [Trueperella sp. LYQ143]|uniref:ABC transporter ATP-binding protein n=1 Tax=unclassified Trueperella TaxID=2630174 RepID=UPI003982E32D
MSILVCDDLVCGYGGEPLFSPLNLRIDAGQSVAITGRSGIGKSTLLLTLLGMHRPISGIASVNGENIHSKSFSELARLRSTTIGTVFQNGALLSQYTALDNVMLPRLLWDKHDGNVEREARDLLLQLGVNPQTLAQHLSGGERQRTALARALINKPQLILADEPTGALDFEMRDEVIALIFDVVRQRGCALLLVTHDPEVARQADRTVKLVSARP